MSRPYRLDDGPVVLAVDIGTSRTKAGLLAAKPGILTAPLAIPTSPDPDRLLDSISGLIDDLLEGATAPISAVAFCSYWHGLLCVSEGDEPMGPITTWQSTAGAQSALALAERIDPRQYHLATGCFLHPSYPFVRMHMLSTWPSRHEVRYFLAPVDWMFARFFGRHATSPSMASGTGLTRVGGKSYDPDLLEAAEVAVREVPEISAEVLSGLRGEWAERWPTLSSIPWYLAVGDGACSTFGSGCTTNRRAAMNLGTSGAVRSFADGWPEPPEGLFVYSAPGDRALVGGATSNAGNVLAWAQQVFRLTEDDLASALGDALAPKIPGDLTARAHLAGQRSPDWPADASGSIEGISLDTTARDLLRAFAGSIVDDLAAVVRRLDDWMDSAPTVVASGGLFDQDPAWARLLEDRIGRPLYAAASDEAGLMGAAGFAFEQMGHAIPEPELSPL